jgi:spermidine synthase
MRLASFHAGALMLASGAAALSYQIVWTQQATLWLGTESVSVLAVVAGFFGGLAAGALWLAPLIERSARPGIGYAACEILIGTWGVVLALAMNQAAGLMLALTGNEPSDARQWGVAFGGTFLLLLPATAAMGATLPAMERALARLPGTRGGEVSFLYAINTAGAMLGVLACAFWLLPEHGLTRTALACAGANLLCAVLALLLLDGPPTSQGPLTPHRTGPSDLLPMLGLTGFLGIGYEVLVVRVLAQLTENTVYTFAILLAVYLFGTSFGAMMLRQLRLAGFEALTRETVLLRCTAIASLGGICVLGFADRMLGSWRAPGDGFADKLIVEALLSVVVFLLPTMAMGALFARLGERAVEEGVGLGRALGANTFGAALAPPVLGLASIPLLGVRASLLVICGSYILLTLRARDGRWASAPAAAATALVAAFSPALQFAVVPESGRLLLLREGTSANVAVVEDARGVATLHINNRPQEGSTATLYSDARQALLPLLLHEAPRKVLFLGVGTGATAAYAARAPGLQVDAVELVPEVLEATPVFLERLFPNEQIAGLTLLSADARRFVKASPQRYDLIIADNFHPARSGSAALYTVEHFRAVQGRLDAEGLFCQWLPLHQMDLRTFRSILRSFLEVFPDGHAMLATFSLETPIVGLVGSRSTVRWAPRELRARIDAAPEELAPAALGLGDEHAVLGSFIAGPRSLHDFSTQGLRNTDDHPVVAYLAPRLIDSEDAGPSARLIELIRALSLLPDEVLGQNPMAEDAQRLRAYAKARTIFLEAGRGVQPNLGAARMLDRVEAPLMAALEASADFRPAYEPLLQLARALSATDPARGSRLLEALDSVHPHRPDARILLQQAPAP